MSLELNSDTAGSFERWGEIVQTDKDSDEARLSRMVAEINGARPPVDLLEAASFVPPTTNALSLSRADMEAAAPTLDQMMVAPRGPYDTGRPTVIDDGRMYGGERQRNNDWYQELPDGTKIWRYPDGTVIRMGPDGSYSRQNPDGSSVVRDARGNTVWRFADGREYRQGADGSMYVRNADGSTYEKTPDGRQTWHYADGTTIRQNPDGSSSIRRPDGSSIEKLADGTTIWKKPDGTILRQNPDGSKEQRNPDGSVFKQLPDGTIIRQMPDGMTITQRPDGSFAREWPDHSRVEANSRGQVTLVAAGNGANRQYFYDGGGQLAQVKSIDGQIWQRQGQYDWVSNRGERWRGVIAGVDQEGNAYYYPYQGQPFVQRRDGRVEPWNGRTSIGTQPDQRMLQGQAQPSMQGRPPAYQY